MNGKCGTRVNDTLGTPGTQTTIAEEWNYRFGIYKKLPDFSTDPSYMRPDFTGYSYTAANWPSQRSAFDGTDPGRAPSAQNFVTKRANFGACAPDGRVNTCETINAIRLNSFKDLAASAPARRVTGPGAATGGS